LHFLFQNLIFVQEPITNNLLIPERVLCIPLPENVSVLFMAGENPDQVWRDLCTWKGCPVADTLQFTPLYGSISPARGCSGSKDPDGSFTDFIRRYRNHPQGD
jgi:hypothetical protein